MKKLQLLLIWVGLSSCSTVQTFYQFCDISSDIHQTSDGTFRYSDAMCEIEYDFWCNGGNPGFIITNNTDQMLNLDMSKSFFVRNGIAYDYWLDRTVTASASRHNTSTATKTGTSYGYWNSIGRLIQGSVTASVASSSATSETSAVSTAEKKVIVVPPHCSKAVAEYSILSIPILECEYNSTPSGKQLPKYEFPNDSSPLKFCNILTYTLGNDPEEHFVRNDFQVSAISFMNEGNAVKTETVRCGKDIEDIRVVQGSRPDRCYITYVRRAKSSPTQSTEFKKKRLKEKDYYDIYALDK